MALEQRRQREERLAPHYKRVALAAERFVRNIEIHGWEEADHEELAARVAAMKKARKGK
jgi:hypothetical protein